MQRGLVVLGIVVLAFNLRPAAVSVGPVLGDISDGLRHVHRRDRRLTSLPVLAFAVFGALAPRLARMVGLHRLTLARPAVPRGGLAGRAMVSSVPVFLALSLLALAGMASANVLLPSLVKLHFPDRIGLMTVGLLDGAGDRAHLGLGADGPDQRGPGRLAFGPDWSGR